MLKPTVTGQIYYKIIELLDTNPDGLHWSELISILETTFPHFHPKTINGCVWKLIERYPDQVYKPEKGLFKLLKYKK